MATTKMVWETIDTINEKGGIERARAMLKEYAKALEREQRDEWKEEKNSYGWAVGFYGWGSAEDDLYFTSCETPKEALEEAMEHHKKGWWVPSTFDDENRAFVYELVEDSTWVRSGWRQE